MAEIKIIKRADLRSFMGITNGTTVEYQQIGLGFTNLSESKNPQEYSRKYIHEQTERTDVVGFAPAFAYSVDAHSGEPVCQEIMKITDNELLGSDSVRDIIAVNLWDGDDTTGYTAFKRSYSVIPDGRGDGTDALVYTGNMKANGDAVKGKFDMTAKAFTPDAPANPGT